MTPFAILEKRASKWNALEEISERLRAASDEGSIPRKQLGSYWKNVVNPFGSMRRIAEEGRGGRSSAPFTLKSQVEGASLGSIPLLLLAGLRANKGGNIPVNRIFIQALAGGFLGAGGGGMWAQKKHNDRAQQDLVRLGGKSPV